MPVVDQVFGDAGDRFANPLVFQFALRQGDHQPFQLMARRGDAGDEIVAVTGASEVLGRK